MSLMAFSIHYLIKLLYLSSGFGPQKVPQLLQFNLGSKHDAYKDSLRLNIPQGSFTPGMGQESLK